MSDMAENGAHTGKPLTGAKVFAIFVGAFSIIFAVNFFMAYSAVHTFPGLEVEDSYVASQSFDEERKAQEALGWDVTAGFVGNDTVTLKIIGPDGKPARIKAIEGMIGRTTSRFEDQDLHFVQNDQGVHVAQVDPLDFGKWEMRYVATAANGVPFRQRVQLIVPKE